MIASAVLLYSGMALWTLEEGKQNETFKGQRSHTKEAQLLTTMWQGRGRGCYDLYLGQDLEVAIGEVITLPLSTLEHLQEGSMGYIFD